MNDDDQFAASLSGLSGLLTDHRPLEATLVRVAQFAVQAIPGADGAGLTLLETDRPQTVVATADFVRTVDDVQYGLGEGPCVSAVADGRTFVSGNLGGEPQWPRFGPRVGRLGVHSAVAALAAGGPGDRRAQRLRPRQGRVRQPRGQAG